MLRDLGLSGAHPERTFATVDHIVPTDTPLRPVQRRAGRGDDRRARAGLHASSASASSIPSRGEQGIVHVIGPELGLTQPGMTIACGDSHTSTHGAFGAIAFGIGTTQVRDVLATQTLSLERAEGAPHRGERQARPGRLREGRHPGHHPQARRATAARATPTSTRATPSTRFSMEERMTLCNMSIEGGARVGYVNPDQTTFEYLKGRDRTRRRARRGRGRVAYWRSHRAPTRTRRYDDVVADRRERTSRRRSPGASHPGQAICGEGERAARPRTCRATPSARSIQRGARVHAARGRRSRSRARRSTSPSSAAAPTAASRISARSRSCMQAARRSRRACARWSFRARWTVAQRGRGRGARRGLPRSRLRVARAGLLDVPGDEPRQADRPTSCARPRRTATSRAARAAPPGAPC